MGEKNFATDNDLTGHLKADWKTVHGVWEGARSYIDAPPAPAWTAVTTFYENWVNYGSPYGPARYFKDRFGIVRLEGLVHGGTVGEIHVIFILPTGYRPAYDSNFAASAGGNGFGRIRIKSTGEVQAIAGDNGWFSLDGITFRAA